MPLPFQFHMPGHINLFKTNAADVFDLNRIWNNAKKTSKTATTNTDESFTNMIFQEIKEWTSTASENSVEPETAMAALFSRIHNTKKDDAKKTRNRLLLIQTVNFLAEHKIVNRTLVRFVLGDLILISGHIDREVIMFEYHEQDSPKDLTEEQYEQLLIRQEYVLSHVCGWKLPPVLANIRNGDSLYYLELPIKRAGIAATNHLLSEAIYRQKNPDFVLLLLKYGVMPSCLYLWPLCVLIDIKLAAEDRGPTNNNMENYNQLTDEDVYSEEARIIHMFCRARRFIRMHVIRSADDHDSVGNLPSHVTYDDVLVIPVRATPLIPEDRYKHPATLKHYSRLFIRKTLFDQDRLPCGLAALPLPEKLKEFLDLQFD